MIGPARIQWLRWVNANPYAGKYTRRVFAGAQTAIKNDEGKVDRDGQPVANAAIKEAQAEKETKG